jgi:O-succinylbenzoate synthase
MIIQEVQLVSLHLPIKTPFRVSFGTVSERIITLVKLFADNGQVGYGECSALHFPSYVPEFTAGELLILKGWIVPAILGKEINSPAEFRAQYAFIKGHNFAKHAAESAFWHLLALEQGKSLKELFGGTRNRIEVGESLGIKPTIQETLDEVQLRLDEGFRRIKVKIMRSRDIELVRAIRNQFPNICLTLDANSDYTLDHLDLLKELDRFDLLMLEQPLGYDDIVDHSILQQQMKTPICLDESILNAEDARKALYLGSCRNINIKPARVGGPLETIAIHDLCQAKGIPVWCGGLLETGIGRAFNIALASLPGFTQPADMSETRLFYHEDIVDNPYEIKNGWIDVPNEPGLGFQINDQKIAKYTVGLERMM